MMRLPNLCLSVLTFTGTVAAPQNDEKVLRRFGIVWSHLPQYQKLMCGRCFWFPPHVFWDGIEYISNVINYREYYFDWKVVVDFHRELFVYFTQHDGYFRNLSIFCINVRNNARDNVGINMRHPQVVNIPKYGSLYIFNSFVHNTPIIFVPLVAYLFQAFGEFCPEE